MLSQIILHRFLKACLKRMQVIYTLLAIAVIELEISYVALEAEHVNFANSLPEDKGETATALATSASPDIANYR